MDDIKRRRIAGQVKRFCERFAQGAHSELERVIPQQSLLQWIEEEAGYGSVLTCVQNRCGWEGEGGHGKRLISITTL
jgi:hypothetical protein